MVLNVDRKVKRISLKDLNSKTSFEVLRAVGVVIDNAVDEVSKLKDKSVFVDIHIDGEYFIIEVSNKCHTLPDLSRIDDEGYTTKEEGHGYGLSLLREICINNKEIMNERKIIGNIFCQIIKIKM